MPNASVFIRLSNLGRKATGPQTHPTKSGSDHQTLSNKKLKSFVFYWFPAKVAKTNSFTMFLKPWVPKALVFIAFEQPRSESKKKTLVFLFCFQCFPTKVAKTISFTMFWEPRVQKTMVFIAFEQPWSESNGPTNPAYEIWICPCKHLSLKKYRGPI